MADAARLGGTAEVDRLLDAIRPLVARWAVVLTGCPDEAEDVTQTVLLRVHGSLSQYSSPAAFTTWVYRITHNVFIDWERKSQRDRVRVERFTREQVAAWLPEAMDPSEACGAVEQLKHFMRHLSPQQRAVLDLIELQGFNASEVGEMLEVSPSTVRVHLHRARAVMAAVVNKENVSHG